MDTMDLASSVSTHGLTRNQTCAKPIQTLLDALSKRRQSFQNDGTWDLMDAHAQAAYIDKYRLAYLGEQVVNWCPKLGTVLANEEVIDGKSERGRSSSHS